jgi:2-keto-4-pentenoate hydratase/2-oxohepta-3-ene-1,7-dioic acid hydratase in catechol pathway
MAGYMPLNDVSATGRTAPANAIGKTDTFCPMYPLITADEIPTSELMARTVIGDEVLQEGHTV